MKSIIQEASSIAKAIEQSLEKAGNPKDFSVKILEYPEKNFFRMTTRSAKIALYWDEKGENRRALEPHLPHDSAHQQPHSTRPVRDHYSDTRSGTPRGEYHARGNRDRSDRSDRSERPERVDRTERSERLERSSGDRFERSSRKPQGHDGRRSEREGQSHTDRRWNDRPSDRPVVAQHREEQEHSSYDRRRTAQSDQTAEPTPRSPHEERPIEVRWQDDTRAFAHEWLSTVFRELERSDIMIAVTHEGLTLRVLLDRSFTEDKEKERRLFASLSLLLVEAVKRKFRLNLRGHKIVITHH